jgi:hypothetical protein
MTPERLQAVAAGVMVAMLVGVVMVAVVVVGLFH